MQKKISIFSFFSGIGILDLAFEKNGYNIVFVNEYDNLFIESYRYARMQMNLRAPIYGYRNDSAERYARRRGKKNLLALIAQEREKGNLVGFIGGPPCPDFSVAGKNAGVDGENGRLTKIYFDIICRCHPDFFLFENVKGLVKTEKHRAFYKEMMMKVQAKEERLSQIIAEINSRTGKAYDNDVAVKAMLQIRDILLKSDKLKTSARNNTVKDFEFSYFDDIDDALIEGLEQNQDFFSLLLSNDEIKRQVLGIFTDEIYKSLREA